jgi:hypothetical protein
VQKQETREENTVREKPAFAPPVLKRLGTLRELTRAFNGMGTDGGSGGMSFP